MIRKNNYESEDHETMGSSEDHPNPPWEKILVEYLAAA